MYKMISNLCFVKIQFDVCTKFFVQNSLLLDLHTAGDSRNGSYATMGACLWVLAKSAGVCVCVCVCVCVYK